MHVLRSTNQRQYSNSSFFSIKMIRSDQFRLIPDVFCMFTPSSLSPTQSLISLITDHLFLVCYHAGSRRSINIQQWGAILLLLSAIQVVTIRVFIDADRCTCSGRPTKGKIQIVFLCNMHAQINSFKGDACDVIMHGALDVLPIPMLCAKILHNLSALQVPQQTQIISSSHVEGSILAASFDSYG